VQNFDFLISTRLIFGKGTHKQIGELVKPYGKKVLLHYGSSSIKKSGLYDEVINALKENGLEVFELGGVLPNPRVSLIREGIAICKKEKIDFILGVGGGSVIDSSKTIAGAAYYEGDVWELVEDRTKQVPGGIPLGVILTIPAAGSETGGGAVITNEEKQIKTSFGNAYTRAKFAIINPELFFTLPKNQIANGVADMMSHIFERYFTTTDNTELTDGLCETILRTIIHNGPVVYANPADYNAWCQLGFSANLAHNGLLGLGRAQDWACHGMEHELSAIYDIAHGAGLAILTPNWMKYVYKENMGMFLQFAVKVMGVDGSFRDPEAVILEGIARLRALFNSLGLPSTLSEVGIDESKFELMAKKATGAQYGRERAIGGIKKLSWQDVVEIYRLSK